MSTTYEALQQQRLGQPATWFIVGAAGFIGSRLLVTVFGLDRSYRNSRTAIRYDRT